MSPSGMGYVWPNNPLKGAVAYDFSWRQRTHKRQSQREGIGKGTLLEDVRERKRRFPDIEEQAENSYPILPSEVTKKGRKECKILQRKGANVY